MEFLLNLRVYLTILHSKVDEHFISQNTISCWIPLNCSRIQSISLPFIQIPIQFTVECDRFKFKLKNWKADNSSILQ